MVSAVSRAHANRAMLVFASRMSAGVKKTVGCGGALWSLAGSAALADARQGGQATEPGEKAVHPFFLYLPHTFPHRPLHASERFRGGHSRAGLYGDTVECLDWSTGRILDTLAELGLDERTLVCFTSDNGPPPPAPARGSGAGAAARGRCAGGSSPRTKAGSACRAIVRWPGKIPAGRVCAELATTHGPAADPGEARGGEAAARTARWTARTSGRC